MSRISSGMEESNSYQVGRYLSFWVDNYWETFFFTVNETVVHGTVNSSGLIVERIGLPWPRWKITTHLFRFVHILTQLYQNLCRMTPPVLTEAIYHCFFSHSVQPWSILLTLSWSADSSGALKDWLKRLFFYIWNSKFRIFTRAKWEGRIQGLSLLTHRKSWCASLKKGMGGYVFITSLS